MQAIIFRGCVIEEAKIISDIIGKLRNEFGSDNLPMRFWGDINMFDQERRCDIAKNEMGITVFKI